MDESARKVVVIFYGPDEEPRYELGLEAQKENTFLSKESVTDIAEHLILETDTSYTIMQVE